MEKTENRSLIVVVGSSNTDMVIKVDHLPRPGETIIGHDFMTNQGGKGANQAVAACRMGGRVAFVARVGDDNFGRQAIDMMRNEGIDTTFVLPTKQAATGIALIPVDSKGENSIIVASGANALLSEDDIEAARTLIAQADIVMMQLETPIPTLVRVARIASEAGARIVLNPAPFPPEPLPEELLKCLTLITPNETEAAMMSVPPVEPLLMNTVAKASPVSVHPIIMDINSCPSPSSLNGRPFSCLGMTSCANFSRK